MCKLPKVITKRGIIVPTKNEKKTFFRELSFERSQIDEANRSVELSFSSETPYKRWFGNEILSHEPGSMDLTRLEEIGVLLFNHKSDMPIGRVESVWLDENDKKGKAKVKFDEDVESEKIYQKVLSGTLKGVSVGYRVGVWEEVEQGSVSTNGRFTGPCSIAARWEPYEISIVSVPADSSVGVGRSLEEPEGINGVGKNIEDEKGAKEMPEAEKEEMKLKALGEERNRVREVLSLCRQFDIDPDEFINSEKSISDIRKEILEKLAKDQKPTVITITADEEDKFRKAAIDGLAMRAGVKIEKPADGAREFQGKRILRLAEECIERATGRRVNNMDDEQLIREALTGTGAFPGILSNVANKSMAQAYQTAPTTYQYWTGKGSNSDFKNATRYRISEAEELEKITEQGEFKDSKLTESNITTSIATYGKSFSITRKALINDDLGALNQVPAIHGAAARRMINKMVYQLLIKNPSIEKAALFSEVHGNLGTGILNIANLGLAKAAMAKQTNIGGKEALNIQPAFLLVPVDLETQAAQLISSAVDPTKANATPNPFANKLSVVADPMLSNPNEWYLSSATGICPTIEVTSLNGKEEPTMESAIQFDTLGIKWRVYLDVGVNLIDFRGLYKSGGTN